MLIADTLLNRLQRQDKNLCAVRHNFAIEINRLREEAASQSRNMIQLKQQRDHYDCHH